MPRKLFSIEQILSILSESPQRIAALTAGLEPEQCHITPAEGEWSVNDVLAHLRACSDVWGGNILKILDQDMPIIIGLDPRSWMKETDYPSLDFKASLESYIRQRANLLVILDNLPGQSWSRQALVKAWGQVYHKTVHTYADSLARHERTHIKQIARIVAAVRAGLRDKDST